MSKAPCRTKKAASEEEGGTAKSMTACNLWRHCACLQHLMHTIKNKGSDGLA